MIEEKDATHHPPKKRYDTPKVHVWARFVTIQDIYPLTAPITVTLQDIRSNSQNEDQQRWVEVPDDSMSTRLTDLNYGDKEPELIIEYFDIENNTWPMAKSRQTFQNFQVGDIIDVIVK